ncbi:MAG: response regulator [Gemmataceae bacterium]
MTEVSPLRVLVVDDARDTADTLAYLVRLWGHEVRVAYDGFAALGEALEYGPDIVLMDIGMPGMDGWEAVSRLRQQEGCRRALCVAVTAYGKEEDRSRSRQAGFDYHLVKPLDPEVLEQLLAEQR